MLLNSHEEEIRLIQEAQQDLQKFAEIYKKYVTKIYQYFQFRVWNKDEAEELTSITFEKALTKLNSFRNQGYPFSTWLFKIAHNCLVDFFREQDKKKTISLDELAPAQEPTTTKAPNFIQVIDDQADVRKVMQIIKTLTPLQQDVWGVKLSGDFSSKQIAETLNITENLVNVTLCRSLKVIKNKFFR